MAQRTAFIIDPNTASAVRVDDRGDMRTANVLESRTLAGTMFSHLFEDLALANGASLDILIETDAVDETLLRVELTGDAPLSLELYEAGTYTPPGSAAAPFNRNRIVGGTPVATVWDAPTVTTVGTLLDKKILTGSAVSLPFWMLDLNTRFLVRATNPGGGPKSVVLSIDMIE